VNTALWLLPITLATAGCGGKGCSDRAARKQGCSVVAAPLALELPGPSARHSPTVKPGERWPVVHYGAALPARAVFAVGAETWLATPSGIVRFGRALWRDTAPTPLGRIDVADGLPATGVNALARGSGGELLAATDNGVARITSDGRARALPALRGRVTALAGSYAGTWNGLFDLKRRSGAQRLGQVRYQIDSAAPLVRGRLEPAEAAPGALVRLVIESAPAQLTVSAADGDLGDEGFAARVMEDLAAVEARLPSGEAAELTRGADDRFTMTFAAPQRAGRHPLAKVARDAAGNKTALTVELTVR